MQFASLDIDKNLQRFLETTPLFAYPADVLKDIKLVSFKPDGAVPFGSFIYRMQKYPGDVDLIEEFSDCCNPPSVVFKFALRLQRMILDIQNSKLHYFSEFKAGFNKFFDPKQAGEMTNGNFNPNIQAISDITKLGYKFGFFNREEINILDRTIKKYVRTKHLNQDDYDKVTSLLRNHYILRWTAKDILNGKIKVKDVATHTINLVDALAMHSPVKIDVLALINNKFIEITNFIMLAYYARDKNLLVPINVDPEVVTSVPIQLRPEIEKLYYSNMWYSPFKMVKRIYSLARNLRLKNILKKIIPLVSSNISEIYQIKSELEVISLLFERVGTPPIATINKQLDGMKIRLAKIVQIDDNNLKSLSLLLDNLIIEQSKSVKLSIINEIIKLLKQMINYYTISYLDKVGMNPPPAIVLPSKRKYDSSIVREPESHPTAGGIEINEILDEWRKRQTAPVIPKLTSEDIYMKQFREEQTEKLAEAEAERQKIQMAREEARELEFIRQKAKDEYRRAQQEGKYTEI